MKLFDKLQRLGKILMCFVLLINQKIIFDLIKPLGRERNCIQNGWFEI
jgi:hypothetical protein